MIVQSHPDEDLLCDAMQEESGLWGGWLYLLRDGEIHQPLLNTTYIYKTPEEAVAIMKETITAIELDILLDRTVGIYAYRLAYRRPISSHKPIACGRSNHADLSASTASGV